MNYSEGLMKYIDSCPTNYHSVAKQMEILSEAGFKEIKECDNWSISAGDKFYVNRNNSAIIAFAVPKKLEDIRFNIMASHCDSPNFKVKNNPDMKVENTYVKLNVEGYGGAVLHTWIDRPLSVAGRVFVEGEKECRLVDITKNICMIPGLAIHMNRDINKGYEWNIQRDMLPLMTINPDITLMDIVAKVTGVEADRIMGHDLYVYNREEAKRWGAEDEFVSAPRLDDQACAYSSLMALCEACGNSESVGAIMVHAVFDNEEVGSSTIQGACSTFLKDTLERIIESLCQGEEKSQSNDCFVSVRECYHKAIAKSFMFSADNAHALHPNYTDKCDPTNRPVMGKGVVLKFAGNQKYTTDGASAAKTRELARSCGVNLQTFHNKSDMAGGSTLGNLSANQVPVATADIGIAQLSMHSCYETLAGADIEDMVKLARTMYEN